MKENFCMTLQHPFKSKHGSSFNETFNLNMPNFTCRYIMHGDNEIQEHGIVKHASF